MYKIVQNKFSKLFYLIVYVSFEYQLLSKYGVLSGTTPIKKLSSTKTTYEILNNNKIQLFNFTIGLSNIKSKLTSEENFKSKEEFLKEFEIADWAKSELLMKTNDKTGLFNA